MRELTKLVIEDAVSEIDGMEYDYVTLIVAMDLLMGAVISGRPLGEQRGLLYDIAALCVLALEETYTDEDD